jgi:dihydropyrimidine dehydrogenase (NAD+) subunit PreA
MHYGYRMVEDMIDGLANWMDEKGFAAVDDFLGRSVPRVTEWKHLDLNYKIVARIHPEKCIGCDLCYIACWDGAHQCIHLDGHAKPAAVESASRARIVVTPIAKLDGSAQANDQTPPRRIPRVDEAECVGCNLCWLVCPVENCITMEKISTGKPKQSWEERSLRSSAT